MVGLCRVIVLTVLLVGCASADSLINRAIKRDPLVVKQRLQAEVTYNRLVVDSPDSGLVPILNEISFPMFPTTDFRTRKEKKYDGKIARQKWEQEKLTTRLLRDSVQNMKKLHRLERDSLKAAVKRAEEEARLAKAERKSTEQQTRTKKWEWLKENWGFLLALILVGLLVLGIVIYLLKKSITG